MKLIRNERDIFWKEWRTKRALLISVAAVILSIPLIILALRWGVEMSLPRAYWMDIDAYLLVGLTVMTLGVAVVSATLFSREEHDPARGFLYTLPISRSEILGSKLRALGAHLGALAGVGAVAALIVLAIRSADFEAAQRGALDHRSGAFTLALPVIIGFSALALQIVAGALLTVIFSFHFRSPLVTTLIAPIPAILMILLLRFSGAGGPTLFLIDNVILAGALVAWMYFVYCRTPLHELSDTKRVLLWLLFVAVFAELEFTFFLCDFRDLAFLVFGV